MTPTTVMKRLLHKKGVISLCRPTIFFASGMFQHYKQTDVHKSVFTFSLTIPVDTVHTQSKALTLKQKYCMKLTSKCQTSCKKLHLRLSTIYLKLSSKNIKENKIDARAFL